MSAPIFDLDGTLVDTVYARVFAAYRGYCDAAELHVSLDEPGVPP